LPGRNARCALWRVIGNIEENVEVELGGIGFVIVQHDSTPYDFCRPLK
jgi:hypothetical protein